MNRDFLVHFKSRARQCICAAICMQKSRCNFRPRVAGGFMVHGQQAALAAVGVPRRARGIQAKVLHAVVVVACAVFKIGVAAVIFKVSNASGHRVAQCKHGPGNVARRNRDFIKQVFGHCSKAQHCSGCWWQGHCRHITAATCRQTQCAQYSRTCCTQCCLEHAAPAHVSFDDVIQAGVVGWVVVVFVMALKRRAVSCAKVNSRVHGVVLVVGFVQVSVRVG